MRSCKLPSGAAMPVFGLGTWRMGESAPAARRGARCAEIRARARLSHDRHRRDVRRGRRRGDRRRGDRGPRHAAVHREQGLSAQRHAARHDRRLRAQPEAPAASSASISTCCTGAAARGSRRRSRPSTACARPGKIADFGVSNFDLGDMEEAARLDKGLTGSQPGALLPVAPRARVRPAALDAPALDPADGLFAARPGRPAAQARAARSSPTRSAARRRSWRSPGCWPSPASSPSPSRPAANG